MKIRDLGALDGTVLLFGGPYSNLQATQALLEKARALRIPARRVICTGDMVAYGADPAGVVAALRGFAGPVVAGNVERQLAEGAGDCGCGFTPGSTCDRLSAGWYPFADARIGAEARAWMRDLPDVVTFRLAGRRVAVIHGGVSDISRFLWPVTDEAEFRHEISLLERDIGAVDEVVAGHCGVPFRRQLGRHWWTNAGVMSLPPNDGGAATRFALMEGAELRLERLAYDAAAARAAMEAAGLTQGYHAALTSGWWPSEEVLPGEMRRGSCDG
ncbi:MAG: metallophosphoesterase family protein [Erythrobacter sp.]|nr:metallophosphoesterase family protein [Erythrobacter sp.]